MRVCGIEIKSDTAVLVVASVEEDQFAHVPCATKKIALPDDDVSANVKSFASAIDMFLRDNAIDAIAIKKRNTRGDLPVAQKPSRLKG